MSAKAATWHPFASGVVNIGQRSKPDTVALIVACMDGTLAPGAPRLDGLACVETADMVKRGIFTALPRDYEVTLGPDVPDGKRVTLVTRRETCTVLKSLSVLTDTTYTGKRGGKTVRMANKRVNGVEVRHLPSQRTPILWGGHDVDGQSDPLDRRHAAESMRATAAWLQEQRGIVIGGKDWNCLPSAPQYRPIRELDLYRDDVEAFGGGGTFAGRSGKYSRNIDRMVWRMMPGWRADQVHRLILPGWEKGGSRGHKLVAVQGRLRARATS